MQIYGELFLGVSLVWSVICTGLAFLGARFRRQNLIDSARYGLYALTALVWAMALLLSWTFVTHEFANKYVATYSDRGMPKLYLLAAFWGGEKGALLFWVTSLLTFSAISIHGNRAKEPRWIGTTLGILFLSVGFFLMLMVYESNPFASFLTHGGPADGQGMNPLLQNPTMTIHPPSLLTGYITFTIPFAYGVAALIVNKLDTEWIRVTRLWTVISWLFLTIGLVLGGAWAYEELGWGGVWMWDPVENAGFIPWLTSTAFLHSVMIQERRGMLKRWNAVLVCLTFFLTILGTFLTRSQLIASVHAFADSTIAGHFLGYMVVLIIISTWAIGLRWKALKSEHRVESFWSRESFFILNTGVLVLASLVVVYGTIFPKFSELEGFRSGYNALVNAYNATLGLILPHMEPLVQALDLGEPWFNKVMVPLGLILLFLSAVGPLMPWRRTTAAQFRKLFLRPILWSALPTAVVIAVIAAVPITASMEQGATFSEALAQHWSSLRLVHGYAFCAIYFGFFVLLTVTSEYLRSLRIRMRTVGGSWFRNGLVLLLKARRRFGGYLVHIGIVLCFWAFTGNAFKLEIPEQVLHPGDVLEIGEYRATFARLDEVFEEDGRFVSSRASVLVQNRGAPAPEAMMRSLGAALEAHGLEPAIIQGRPGHSTVQVVFEDPSDAQRLLAAGLLVSELERNYERLPDDTKRHARVYRFKHEKVLELQPMAFMRHVNELKGRASEISALGVKAEVTPGSTVVRLAFPNEAALQAFGEIDDIAHALPPVLNVKSGAGPTTVDVLAVGSGRLLLPEVRFYEKHATPTTETAIESHPLEAVSLVELRRPAPKKRPERPRRVSPAGWAIFLPIAILAALLVTLEVARADGSPKPSAAGSGLEKIRPIAEHLYCPGHRDGSWVVDEHRNLVECGSAEGKEILDLMANLARRRPGFDAAQASHRRWLLGALIKEDPRIDRLLEVPAEQFNAIWLNTKCLCGCSHILFQCGLECGPALHWKQEFRQMLAAGMGVDAALQTYIASWNSTLPPTATPYNRRSVVKDPEGSESSWGIPLIAASVFVLFILIFLLRRGRQAEARRAKGHGTQESLKSKESLLIDDLIEETDGPLV